MLTTKSVSGFGKAKEMNHDCVIHPITIKMTINLLEALPCPSHIADLNCPSREDTTPLIISLN